ncbi:MAG TPA: phosphatase PAP2 family protein [Candidatus Kapabacteria bacterium]|nr:phosphatase PAP2 family protein [Candidatus Kapabacteria bacterium]
MESEVAVERKPRVVSPRGMALSARMVCELAPHEVLLLVFAALFSVVAVVASERVTHWPEVLIRMGIACAIIVAMNLWASIVGTKGHAGRWPRRLRLLYLFPVIPIYFKTAELISYPIHGHDFDSLLIAADRMIFGVNPTWWLAEHFPTWPVLTEYLMICYALFYFLPMALAIELYLKGMGRRHHASEGNPAALRQLDQLVFIIVYGFMLSYAGYCFMPAIGPRFTLHNFLDLSKDLPGLWLTHPLRVLLDRGENILPGMAIPEILRRVTRDAFPSGHTDITLLTMLLAFKFRARLRWPIAILGSSLIFSTVYLRYHYVVDVLAGAVLAVFTLYTWEWVRKRMVVLQSKMIR